jgi:hypothetical protein
MEEGKDWKRSTWGSIVLQPKGETEVPAYSPQARLLSAQRLEHFRNTRRLFEGRARWLFLEE